MTRRIIASLLFFLFVSTVFPGVSDAQAQHSKRRHKHRVVTKSPAYPNPKNVRVPQKTFHPTPPGPIDRDRYAAISEAERFRRMWEEECQKRCYGIEGVPVPPCPLCEDDPKTPCGECKMCKAGFPCERTLCRHCVQQRSQNMCNSCDLSAGDEPCGTCDACREHRSDPCEHADDGHGLRGEFNPYKEPRTFAIIPRPILDTYNNGARKFPVYYNPAPYYRPHWNPSLFTGYARPYSFRWSCPLCFKDPCECDKPGFAGQVPYAYACKFCNRNPCACAEDICNVNKEMNPKGRSMSLAADKKSSTRIQDAEQRKQPAPLPSLRDAVDETQGEKRGSEATSSGAERIRDLIDDEDEMPATEPRRPAIPKLDAPE